MMLALRNKQMLALAIMIVLTLLVVAFFVLSFAHINLWQAIHVSPNAFYPYN
ncbi:hypothetical protein KDW_37140 [Dictyobacter vulcani]|uniref:Uncharacterized protein n=1 Tax=Dictyobacter vulcani TaxID=2607529 RepID=A0A5J4KQS4_9CHLR|nr:hypothetical protein [Dictyobacter vulcani]GER89552.1 hypothetical protein KDW_37140 [Dictyobacter vulcani]